MVWPNQFSLQGWFVLFSEPRLLDAVFQSLFIGFVVILLNFIFAVPAAYVLAFEHFKGKSIVESVLLLPLMIPSLAVAMGIHLSFIRIGLADQWMGVVLVHLLPTVPYTVKIIRAGFESIGNSYSHAAATLGATKRKTYYTVYLPLLLPSIRSSLFLILVISMSQYILTALIGGGNVITLAIIYFPFLSSVNDAVIASFSLLFALLPIFSVLVFEILFRLLVPYQKKLQLERKSGGDHYK
jgi:putative spermidine/putrescine transport system permease protein